MLDSLLTVRSAMRPAAAAVLISLVILGCDRQPASPVPAPAKTPTNPSLSPFRILLVHPDLRGGLLRSLLLLNERDSMPRVSAYAAKNGGPQLPNPLPRTALDWARHVRKLAPWAETLDMSKLEVLENGFPGFVKTWKSNSASGASAAPSGTVAQGAERIMSEKEAALFGGDYLMLNMWETDFRNRTWLIASYFNKFGASLDMTQLPVRDDAELTVTHMPTPESFEGFFEVNEKLSIWFYAQGPEKIRKIEEGFKSFMLIQSGGRYLDIGSLLRRLDPK